MSKAKSFTSIRELESGRHQARYRPRGGLNVSQTFDTRAEAEEWLAALSVVLREPDRVENLTRALAAARS